MQRKALFIQTLSLLTAGILYPHSGYAQDVPIATQIKPQTYTTNTLANIASAGLTTVRFGIIYKTDFDGSPDKVEAAWQPYDALITLLKATGTKVLMTAFVPSSVLATQVQGTTGSQRYSAVRQVVQRDLTTLATQAFQRHGSTISAVEIWNEPDNATFWDPTFDLGTFDNAMTGICNTISTWPIREVYGYGFTQIPKKSSDDTSSSTQLYDDLSKAGATSCLRGISAHFYSIKPEELLSYVPYSRGIIKNRLFLTEFGATSDPNIRTEEAQAQLILRYLLNLFIAKPDFASIYEWKDTASASNTQQQHYGMTDSSDAVKPAYTALKNLYSLYVPSTSTTGSCDPDLFCRLDIVQKPYTYTVYWRGDARGTKLSTKIGNIDIMEKQLSLDTPFTQVSAPSVFVTSTPIVVQTPNPEPED